MLLKLQKYDYIIQYIPGKDMVLVDKLSGFPSHKINSPIILTTTFKQNTLILNA